MPPLLLPTVALIAGVVFAEFGIGPLWSAILIGIALVIYLLLLQGSKRPSKALRLNRFHRCWIAILFIGIGITVGDLSHPENLPEGKDVIITGRVTQREALTSGDRMRVILKRVVYPTGEVIENPGTNILLYSEPVLTKPGDIIQARGYLGPIKDSPDKLSRGFKETMRNQGVTSSMRVNGEESISVIGYEKTLTGSALNIRDNLSIFIDSTPLAGATKVFLKATLLGDKEGMNDRERSLFADAGIAHILALSGLHVGFIVMILMWLLLPFSACGMYRLRYIMVIVLIWIYAFLTGLSPSIVRASVMTTCLMGGLLLERKRSGLNALCLAVFILVVANPGCIFNAGMQLSVGCVACLLLFAEKLNPVGHRQNPRLYKVASALLATIVATLGTWPLTAWHFSRFPLMFLPVNLLVLPLLPWYISISLIYLILCAFGLESGALTQFLDNVYFGLEELAKFAGSGGSVFIIKIGLITILLWSLGIIILGSGLNINGKSRRMMIWSGGWMLLVAIFTIPLFQPAQPEGYIIGRSTDKYMLTVYKNGEESESLASPGEISVWNTHGRKIAVIDADINEKVIEEKFILPDIAIVGKNCWNSLDEIAERFKPKQILIHPSIMTKREERLLDNHTSGTPVHSLRKQGAYKKISFGEE